MKGFYQYLAPFAPDYSGAACVFFGMDGLVVLCDPGGCSGNVCGYDEPRFYGSQQALFSAAIRDMDAILGKDDLLERKIVQAASEREYRFIALVGTPVVSVIASDLKGVANLLSRKTGIAAVSVDTDGMKLYDTGAEKAYMALLRLPGALERVPSDGERLGVFGASPLEMPSRLSLDRFKELVRRSFPSASAAFYGGEPLPSLPDRTLAVSPSGLKACRFLKERFGIPYSVSFPMNPEFERVLNEARGRCGSKILIIHQQAAACALRSLLIASGAGQRVDVGSWFMMDSELAHDGDMHFDDEEEFIQRVSGGGYDVIIADPMMKNALRDCAAEWIDLPHYAVSGNLFAE